MPQNAKRPVDCRERARLQFTRGRPCTKDDNAHIEQKTWTPVRKLVGDGRYDSPAALEALNALYADLRLFQNLCLPSVKLVKKTRVGSRLRRQYDAPQTPFARVRACAEADAAKIAELARIHATLDPFLLAARIDRQLRRLYDLANHRRGGRPVDAARPVENGQSAFPTRSLENPQNGFSTSPTGSSSSSASTKKYKKNSVTEFMAR